MSRIVATYTIREAVACLRTQDKELQEAEFVLALLRAIPKYRTRKDRWIGEPELIMISAELEKMQEKP